MKWVDLETYLCREYPREDSPDNEKQAKRAVLLTLALYIVILLLVVLWGVVT